ncbi:MAG TPA: carboxymuconolactone decarboxylase family protein [Saprospiraceae bacterium]|nr:carboxymuconolactone decarboxylase family protein [Saprospiraceae bacterium]
MKQPLVKPVGDAFDAELQKLIEFYNETLGFCPNSIKTMYHRPHIAFAFIAMNKAVMQNDGSVTSSFKRLIGYISSHAAGCRYCQAHTIRAAERYGAGKDQLEQIWEYETSPAFTEKEKAALSFALHASTLPNGVDDAIAQRLRTHWTEGEIVEILGVVALFGFLNRWNDSMGTELENGAIESGDSLLHQRGWNAGKHRYL